MTKIIFYFFRNNNYRFTNYYKFLFLSSKFLMVTELFSNRSIKINLIRTNLIRKNFHINISTHQKTFRGSHR